MQEQVCEAVAGMKLVDIAICLPICVMFIGCPPSRQCWSACDRLESYLKVAAVAVRFR